MSMKIFRTALILFIGLFIGLNIADAQLRTQQQQPQQQSINPDSISDSELQLFADASQQAQSIQMDARQQIQQIVSDEGMKFSRFQKIMMSKQNPKMAKQVNVTDDEQKTIDNMKPKIMQVQQDSQQKMMKAIKSSGLELQRFQQIFKALRQNKELLQRYRGLVQQDSSSSNQQQ